jgi:Flp pilus assembly protein CpaB
VTGANALVYVIEAGMRGEAIKVDQVVTAGGLVLPGDHVDVLWVPFSGGPAFRLLSDVEVTAVSQAIVDIAPVAPGVQTGLAPTPAPGANSRVRASDELPIPEALTVTLLISPDDSKTLFCADHFAQVHDGTIRLAVRSFGDSAPAQIDAPECPPTDLFLEFSVQQ